MGEEECIRMAQIRLRCGKIHELAPCLAPGIGAAWRSNRLQTCRRATTWPWLQRVVRPWHSTCKKWCVKDPGAVSQAGGGNEVSAMIAGSMGTLLRVLRPLGATLGIVSLLALQPEPARLARSAAAHELSAANAPRALVLSEQARRFLLLQYRSFSTEFMGCMIGEVQAGVVVVKRIAPADVEPEESTPRASSPSRPVSVPA